MDTQGVVPLSSKQTNKSTETTLCIVLGEAETRRQLITSSIKPQMKAILILGRRNVLAQHLKLKLLLLKEIGVKEEPMQTLLKSFS